MMKSLCSAFAFLAIALAAGTSPAAEGAIGTKSEPLIAVKITTFGKWCDYELMTQKEFTEKETQLKIEEKLMPKAMSAAQKEWSAAEDTKSTRFPITTIVARRITAVGRFTDAGKAKDKLSSLLEKQKDDQQTDAQNDTARQKDMSASQKARALRKDAEYQSAMKLVQTKIEELIAKKDDKPAGDGGNAPEQGEGRERLRLL